MLYLTILVKLCFLLSYTLMSKSLKSEEVKIYIVQDQKHVCPYICIYACVYGKWSWEPKSHSENNEKENKSVYSHYIRSLVMDISLQDEQMTVNSLITLSMTEYFSHLIVTENCTQNLHLQEYTPAKLYVKWETWFSYSDNNAVVKFSKEIWIYTFTQSKILHVYEKPKVILTSC